MKHGFGSSRDGVGMVAWLVLALNTSACVSDAKRDLVALLKTL